MKVLIIGLGSIALKHIHALREISPDFEMYALRSSSDSARVPGVYDIFDYAEIESLKFDFAIISNPTASHQETIARLLPYGIPLFIEKPIFDTLSGRQLVQEILQTELITYVACNLRFLGCIHFLKGFIKDQRINEVNSYCGSYLPDWRPGKDFRKIYSANQEMGGGVHIDLIHELDYLYWLFGKPEQVFVHQSRHSSLEISATDYANYLLSYSNYSVNVILNYYRRDPKRTLEIVLAEGTIQVDLLSNTVSFQGNTIYSSEEGIKETYTAQLRFFIAEVLERKIKFNTVQEAFEVLEICIAKD